MFGRLKRVHFVGIGGVGMSGIALVLRNMGFEVTGSDVKESETTRKLAAAGIRVAIGHEAANCADAQVVVYSSAVRSENPELECARSREIPVIRRAEMLAELMRMKFSVAISGSPDERHRRPGDGCGSRVQARAVPVPRRRSG